jgi:hypothetical protein
MNRLCVSQLSIDVTDTRDKQFKRKDLFLAHGFMSLCYVWPWKDRKSWQGAWSTAKWLTPWQMEDRESWGKRVD